MTRALLVRGLATALIAAAVWPAAAVRAQDQLAVASALYASARYEEALRVLDQLLASSKPSGSDPAEIEKYRGLCLLALGRDNDAAKAFAAVVTADPEYRLDPQKVSPSVRAFFREVRQRTLPAVIQRLYANAKASYDRGDHAAAVDQFSRVLRLLDDEDMAGRLPDLRVLAADFERLGKDEIDRASKASAATKSAAASPAARAPAPSAKDPEAPPPPAAPRIYGSEDADVKPPVVLRQVVPSVTRGLEMVGRTEGLYEITIDELGRVTAVVVRESLSTAYDRKFIEAAMQWKYLPALREGSPVKYRKLVHVSVAR